MQVLVRELSRDTLELLRALFGSTSFPVIPAAQLSALSASNPNAFSAAQRRRGGPARGAAQPGSAGAHAQGGAADGPGGGKPAASLQSVPCGSTAACALLQVQPDSVRAAVLLATEAMKWPDTQTQSRAVAVCRAVAAAAGVPANPVSGPPSNAGTERSEAALQPLVVPYIFAEALRALAAVSDDHISSELILLLRSILLSCAQWQPSPAQQLQALIPAVKDDSIAEVSSDNAFVHVSLLKRATRCAWHGCSQAQSAYHSR